MPKKLLRAAPVRKREFLYSTTTLYPMINLLSLSSIEKRLRELGYDVELDSMTEKDQERFGELKQVAQPRPLTTKSKQPLYAAPP